MVMQISRRCWRGPEAGPRDHNFLVSTLLVGGDFACAHAGLKAMEGEASYVPPTSHADSELQREKHGPKILQPIKSHAHKPSQCLPVFRIPAVHHYASNGHPRTSALSNYTCPIISRSRSTTQPSIHPDRQPLFFIYN
ncbi:hypothetical protein BDN67DRAFT_964545 [Paxillus ammoniavirescens]|nr:hypothetical protein BDN67DRAFT_964545 [Paxillus ammoniavirescens]